MIWSFVRALVSRGPRIEAGATATQRADTFWSRRGARAWTQVSAREPGILCLLFIHPPAHGSEVSLAARNTMDSARIPRASKLLICGLFQKGRVLAQDEVEIAV